MYCSLNPPAKVAATEFWAPDVIFASVALPISPLHAAFASEYGNFWLTNLKQRPSLSAHPEAHTVACVGVKVGVDVSMLAPLNWQELHELHELQRHADWKALSWHASSPSQQYDQLSEFPLELTSSRLPLHAALPMHFSIRYFESA
jgi:hypothetical protein